MSTNKIIAAFVIISAITAFVYQFDIDYLKNIDAVNHFLGGFLLAALIPKEFRKKNFLRAFAAAVFVFFGWEFLEIYLASNGIYPKLFEETISNRIQDVILDFLGFFMFIRPTNKI